MLNGGAGISLGQHDKFGLRSWKDTKLKIFVQLSAMQFLKVQGNFKMGFRN